MSPSTPHLNLTPALALLLLAGCAGQAPRDDLDAGITGRYDGDAVSARAYGYVRPAPDVQIRVRGRASRGSDPQPADTLGPIASTGGSGDLWDRVRARMALKTAQNPRVESRVRTTPRAAGLSHTPFAACATLSPPDRPGDRTARDAHGTGPAARGREQLQPARHLSQERLWNVAVHPRNRHPHGPGPERLVRRAQRYRRLDPCRPGLPAGPAR